MTKYLFSTLVAAAAMAVPAWADATLLGSWDFSSASIVDTNKIYATGGTTSLYITTSTGDSLGSGSLTIVPATSDKTTVDISSYGVTTEEGISVVMTITGWSTENQGTILASIETDGQGSDSDYAAAIGENGTGSSRSPWFAADGHDSNVNTEGSGSISVDWGVGVTVAMTFIGDTLSLYQLDSNGDYTLLAVGTITASAYDEIKGTIEEVAIGSWDGESAGSKVNNMSISSLEIYRGDIMAAPEPSMFGLMFGLGAIGLVATRRRRRA